MTVEFLKTLKVGLKAMPLVCIHFTIKLEGDFLKLAHFEKRGNAWRAQVSWYDEFGKRKFKVKSGFSTKLEARKWANEAEVAKDKNLITNKDPVFAEYFLEWYKRYKEPGKSNSTKRRYTRAYDLIKENFGNIKLTKMTRAKYQDFFNKYGQTHAKVTVLKTNGTIRSCVKDAVSEGLIPLNFTDRINLTWNDKKTRKIDYLNFKQVQDLKKSLLNGINTRYTSRYMLLTIIYTGMRPGEIMVLTWKDIDFKNREIHITKSWDYDNKKILNYDSDEINKETKNKTSTRVIKVDQTLLYILLKLKANNHERIFIDERGTIPTSSAVNKTLRNHLKKIGIKKEGFHFHSLRHTHVALLLFKGVDLYSISKRLGHANMSITASVYAYMLDELKQKSDSQIEKILDQI